MEIAVHHDTGGADVELLREGVDYRQKLVLTDQELTNGLGVSVAVALDSQAWFEIFCLGNNSPSSPSHHVWSVIISSSILG